MASYQKILPNNKAEWSTSYVVDALPRSIV